MCERESFLKYGYFVQTFHMCFIPDKQEPILHLDFCVDLVTACCSDFRYESNGIFVLGVGFFFLQTNFDFLPSHFWRNFFLSFKRYFCPELKFEKIFYLCSFFVKLWGFKDCHFDQFGTINAQYNSRYLRVSGDLIRLINRSKLVEAYLP